jgi:hypothetical protein
MQHVRNIASMQTNQFASLFIYSLFLNDSEKLPVTTILKFESAC